MHIYIEYMQTYEYVYIHIYTHTYAHKYVPVETFHLFLTKRSSICNVT